MFLNDKKTIWFTKTDPDDQMMPHKDPVGESVEEKKEKEENNLHCGASPNTEKNIILIL